MKLIVHPECKAHSDGAFILVNSSRFNMKWCWNNLRGVVLSGIEHTGVKDDAALCYAISRLRK